MGAWVAFEPNAFDGKDLEYKNTIGHDATGRFIPYWYKNGEGTNLEPLASYDVAGDGDYYLISKSTGKANILEPYTYTIDGKEVLITSMSVPITQNGKVIGVAGVDLSIENIQELSSKLVFYKSGFARLLSASGILLSHKDPTMIGQKARDLEQGDKFEKLSSKMQDNQRYFESFHSPLLDKNTYNAYVPIGIRGTEIKWIFSAVVPEAEVYETTNEIILTILASFLGAILIIGVVLFIVSKAIARPISRITELISKQAELDFSTNSEEVLNAYKMRKDEIGKIVSATYQMQYSIKDFVKLALETANSVATSANQLSEAVGESSKTSEEVAKTIEEIASGATDQAKETMDGVTSIVMLGDEIDKNNISIVSISNAVKEVEMLKNEGFSVLRILDERTIENEKASMNVKTIVEETNESMQSIETASDMIKTIASQTNLLALNAAIEAARAGEHGKGFAVVANEIRKLAEQSDQFANGIFEIIKTLLIKTETAVQKMNMSIEIASLQSASLHETREKFTGIANAIENVNMLLETLNRSSGEMINKKDEIINIIENLSAISEENAASTEEASAAIEEQSATIHQIEDESNSLAEISNQLKQLVSKFKY